jgi:hypothetical protein
MAAAFTPDLPGSPEIVVEPDLIRGPRVLVGGSRILRRRERGRPFFPIPMADGSERPLTLHGQFMGLRARFEGAEYPVEPRLTLLELFMVLLPLALVTLEPPIGAVAAALGVMTNLLIIRRPVSLPFRILLAAVVVAGAYLLVGLLAGRLLG